MLVDMEPERAELEPDKYLNCQSRTAAFQYPTEALAQREQSLTSSSSPKHFPEI